MLKIALLMLFRDKTKCFGILLGISLSSFIITQQGAIFCGLMSRTFGFLSDTSQPDIWVMDSMVQYIDDSKPLQETQLQRVRGVDGVAWAVPLYKGTLRARLANGTFQTCNVIGLDDSSLIGGPPIMLKGSLGDLRTSDSVIVDESGANGKLAKKDKNGNKIPLKLGDTIELNENRAVVVGIARTTRTFGSQPLVYTTYSRATRFAPRERKLLSFIMVKAQEKVDIVALTKRISTQTGLGAFSKEDFKWKTINYYIKNTGIPINFGIAVLLGLFVGTAISGQTFYSFAMDNIKYYAALKAMGSSASTILRMMIVQAYTAGMIGYGIGVGFASLFYYLSKNSELAFFLPYQLLLIVGVAVLLICTLSTLLCLRKIISIDPAVVFRN
jgi:putative ABC transport system permease protein